MPSPALVYAASYKVLEERCGRYEKALTKIMLKPVPKADKLVRDTCNEQKEIARVALNSDE